MTDPKSEPWATVRADIAEMWAAIGELERQALAVPAGDPAWPLAQECLRVTLLIRQQNLSLGNALVALSFGSGR